MSRNTYHIARNNVQKWSDKRQLLSEKHELGNPDKLTLVTPFVRDMYLLRATRSMIHEMFMRQFVVPQFIEVEDKIFGPITTRQFIILLAAGITIFGTYRLADTTLFITIAVIIGLIAIVFSFVRVNGQVFHIFLLNIIQTMKRPGLRIWHKAYTDKDLEYYLHSGDDDEISDIVKKKAVHKQHIKDLSLVVNTGGYYRPDEHV